MMLMWRRKKMMRLRRRMLRRKTDPKTGKHTVCEPAQATCAIYREIDRGHLRGQHFVRACAVEMHMDISQDSQEPFCVEIYRKMPDAPGTTSIEHRALSVTVRTPQCGQKTRLCLRPPKKLDFPYFSHIPLSILQQVDFLLGK